MTNITGVYLIDKTQLWAVKIKNKTYGHYLTKSEAENIAIRIHNGESYQTILNEKRFNIIKMLQKYNIDPDNLNSIENWRRCLDWDITTGDITWKACPNPFSKNINGWNTTYINKPAFISIAKDGYLRGAFFGKTYSAHRVLWFLEFGEWPEQIDHINGIPDDNRLINLRNVTHDVNMLNQRIPKNNSSGYMNIKFYNNGNSQVRIERKGIVYAKTFNNLEDSLKYRNSVYRKLGFHINHGNPSG